MSDEDLAEAQLYLFSAVIRISEAGSSIVQVAWREALQHLENAHRELRFAEAKIRAAIAGAST